MRGEDSGEYRREISCDPYHDAMVQVEDIRPRISPVGSEDRAPTASSHHNQWDMEGSESARWRLHEMEDCGTFKLALD
jgi:hypothetical protein